MLTDARFKRLEGLFPGIAEEHRAAIRTDRASSGNEGVVAAFHNVDVVAGRFEEILATDFLFLRPAVPGFVGDALNFQQHARKREMPDSDPGATGISVAVKVDADRIYLGSVIHLFHQHLEVDDIPGRHIGCRQHAVDIGAGRFALLDHVAFADQGPVLVIRARPRHVEEVATQYRIGVVAYRFHHIVETDLFSRCCHGFLRCAMSNPGFPIWNPSCWLSVAQNRSTRNPGGGWRRFKPSTLSSRIGRGPRRGSSGCCAGTNVAAKSYRLARRAILGHARLCRGAAAATELPGAI